MLSTTSIAQIPTTQADVFAFKISGEVSASDMEAMAQHMNKMFDLHESVNMLLAFENYDGSSFGANLNGETMKAQFRALTNVDVYAVVGAPDTAETLIEAIGAIIPVEAKTFDHEDIEEAWKSVGARPI